MSWQLEALASALLLTNVWLVARRSLWNYAFGIAAVCLYAAVFWQARRRVETWALWCLVNLVSVGLYASQALWFTSAVYAVLLGVALYGWRAWGRAERGMA